MRGFTPMFIAAALSVAALLAIIGWQIHTSDQGMNAGAPAVIADGNASAALTTASTPLISPYALISPDATSGAATSSDDISQLGTEVLNRLAQAYSGLQNANAFSTSTANAVAADTLPLLQTNVQYTTYLSSNLKTDSDTSFARMLTYRSDLRTSLAPLLKNTEPEFAIFGSYVQTKDTSYLTQLEAVAQNYRDAVALTAKVVVPEDAVPYHIAILNAMEEFAATLDAMSAQASDPFAVAGLLQNYEQAESDMVTSFNALATYYKSKQP